MSAISTQKVSKVFDYSGNIALNDRPINYSWVDLEWFHKTVVNKCRIVVCQEIVTLMFSKSLTQWPILHYRFLASTLYFKAMCWRNLPPRGQICLQEDKFCPIWRGSYRASDNLNLHRHARWTGVATANLPLLTF